MQARKIWANTHFNSDISPWSAVVFSDELRFTLKPTAQRERVWWKEGERYNSVNLVPIFKSEYQFISVWAALSIHGHTPLIRIDDKLNQQKYIQILKELLLPFDGGTANFIFQQDGCGLHRAKSVVSF